MMTGTGWIVWGLMRLALQAPSQELAPKEIKVDLAVDVLEVQFDVSVHDRRGNFIPGLAPELFHLYEDGREVPIVSFEEIVQKQSGPPSSAQAGSQGRSFLIFVDTYLASTKKVMQIRRELARFLKDKIVEADTLSLAVLKPHGSLETRIGISREEAVRWVEELRPPAGRFESSLLNSYEQARHVLSQVEESVSETLSSNVPPPRNLILLSPGFVPAEPETPAGPEEIVEIIRELAPAGVAPTRAGFDPRNPFNPAGRRFQGPVHSSRSSSAAFEQPSIEALMNSLAGWLSARHITLYAINCGERGPLDLFEDRFSVQSIGPAEASIQGGISVEESMKMNMLRDLAELTGGLAWLNVRNYGQALRNIDEATATVYRIGFRPDTNRLRGRYHKLKVKVEADRKLKVRSPRGYLDS